MIGIYAIRNIINNKIYIGSSNNIKRRFRRHKTELKNKKHSNKYLEKAYHKYGRKCFDFVIIELCQKNKLIEREIFHINKFKSLDPEYGYNLRVPEPHPSVISSINYSKILSESKKGITPSNFEEMQKTRWKGIRVYLNDEYYKDYESYNAAERDLGISKGYIYSYFKKNTEERRKYKQFKFEKI